MKNQGKNFVENTKYRYLDESDQNKGLPQPPLVLPMDDESHLVFELPSPQELKIAKVDLTEAINNRVSVRLYKQEALSLEELSYLLWVTQGIKEVTKRPATLRTVPSAGCRHPFETYLLINNVTSLQQGLYRYLPLNHTLELVNSDVDMSDKITAACVGQAMVKNSAVTFIWTAVQYRTYWRYGERGYRYFYLDAGHVCQNLYLACEAINSGCCAIAAYKDDELDSLLGLDGEQQFAVYVATVGKKKV